MPPLGIQVRALDGGGTQVTVTGDLDAHTVRDMERSFDEIAATRPPRLLVDLTGLHYLSSAGALCLLTSCRAMQEQGTRVVLVRPPCPIYEILDLLGITQLLSFAATPEEARAALQERTSPGR